jgi:hypothetical protein
MRYVVSFRSCKNRETLLNGKIKAVAVIYRDQLDLEDLRDNRNLKRYEQYKPNEQDKPGLPHPGTTNYKQQTTNKINIFAPM